MKRIIQTKRPDVLQGTESEKAAGPVIEEDPPKHIADKLLFGTNPPLLLLSPVILSFLFHFIYFVSN